MEKPKEAKKIVLYQSVAQDLEKAIESGKYQPGDRLPSERELTEQYNISRMTARLAMGELEKKGLSHSIQGKGSFVPVTSLRQDLLQLTNFQELLEQGGYKARTQVLPSDLPFEHAGRATPENYQVLNILGFADDIPVVCYHSRLTPKLAQDFCSEAETMEAEGLAFSTFDLFRKLRVPIGKMDQTLRAVAASQSLAMLLHIAPGSPLIQLQTWVYSPESELLELKTAHYRASYYSFSFTRQTSTFEEQAQQQQHPKHKKRGLR